MPVVVVLPCVPATAMPCLPSMTLARAAARCSTRMPAAPRRRELRVVLPDRAGHHQRVGRGQMVGAVTDADLRAERRELVELRRSRRVAAGDRHSPGQHDARDAGHARAADARRSAPGRARRAEPARPASPAPSRILPSSPAWPAVAAAVPARRARPPGRPRPLRRRPQAPWPPAWRRRPCCRCWPPLWTWTATSSWSSSMPSSTLRIQSGLRLASSMIRPPPARSTGRALSRCSPLPCGSGT